jgi:hypothetical protein
MGNLLEQDYADLPTNPAMQRLLELNALPYYTDESLCKSCTDACRA